MIPPERPRQFGSDEDRLLVERIAAVPFMVPEEVRLRARRGVEERLFSPRLARRAGRLAVVLAASLLAGSALAYVLHRRPSPRPLAPASAPHRRLAPQIVPAAVPPVSLPPAAPRARRVLLDREPARAARPDPPITGGLPSWPLVETEGPAEAAEPAPMAPRLVIAREGAREVSLVSVILAGDRVVGNVRGTPVALTIERSQLHGKLGHRNVSLWLHNDEARGEIGGIPVRMELVPTRDGHQLREGYSVRSSLPFATTRVETTGTSLRWSPGCDAPLNQVATGVYQGRCGSGGEARVAIPPSWQRLPALTRLVLLSFFLTERDPALARLFGPAD